MFHTSLQHNYRTPFLLFQKVVKVTLLSLIMVNYLLKFILFETSCSFCRFIRFIAIQNARSGQALGRFVLILRRPPPCALVSSPAARFLNCRKMYEPRTIHKKSRKKRTLFLIGKSQSRHANEVFRFVKVEGQGRQVVT